MRVIVFKEEAAEIYEFDLDLDGVGQYASLLVEIGIINAAGEEVLDTLVLHERPWKQIHNEGPISVRLMMDRQKNKFQWDENWKFPPRATVMDASQVAALLHAALYSSTSAKFVEYTRGNADLKKVQDFLEVNGRFGYVLGEHKGYGAFPQWQKRLLGF